MRPLTRRIRFSRLLVGVCLPLLVLLCASPAALAAGSQNLWPNGAAGNRANSEWRTSTYGGPGMLTRRRGIFVVA